jgi:polysaccharide chain length determinant protein (PEP-CTERM system associated)
MANDLPNSLSDYFDVVRRRWIYLATILPAALLLAIYLAFTLPPVYRSSATLVLEPSSIPDDWIRSTVTSYANEQLGFVQRRVMTTENLASLIGDVDPYPNQPALSDVAKARLVIDNTETERVDPFTFEPLAESNALSIHFLNSDPDIAVEVARRMADMFLSHTRESRTEAATENYRFLQNQAELVRRDIEDLEQRLAEFKEQYGDALPEAEGRNQQALERMQRDLDSILSQLPQANERRRSLEVELSQISPSLFSTDGDWRAELTSMQKELAEATQRYTEDHPDVRRLRRSIQELSEQAASESVQQVEPDNPEYIDVLNRLESVKQEIAVLENRAARLTAEIRGYEQRLSSAPEVEREYSQLTREYSFALDRLRRIQTDLDQAALGRDVESEARGDRLEMVRTPRRPDSPYSPNRLGILLLGFVLGGALAVGVAAITESVDPTIRCSRDLGTITDIKPIAAIPVMRNESEKRKRILKWAAAATVVVIVITLVGLSIG